MVKRADHIRGIWLPIITPFYDDAIDYVSYRKLIDFYIEQGITGLIPLGTTGESPTITETEMKKLVDETIGYVKGRVPVYIGVGGNCTQKTKASFGHWKPGCRLLKSPKILKSN